MEFIPSKPFTIGMELELQLLDSTTLDLVDGILPLMEFYPGSPYIKPEFIQNTVEIASKVCSSVSELETHMIRLIRDVNRKCHNLDMRLCGAGTHPFSESLALITPLPRYLKIEKNTGFLGHNQITFATHVHIGLTNGEEAITIMRRLKSFLPILVALASNSPFWRGYDTDYTSYRHRILAASKSYGIPPSFQHWENFYDFYRASLQSGVLKSMNDIHWDIRPRPHLGTIEIRTMDSQTTLMEALILAAFIRSLVFLLCHNPSDRENTLPKALPWWFEKENHYQSSHHGLDAVYIYNEEGSTMPLRELVNQVLNEIEPIADELGQADYHKKLCRITESGPGYVRQRNDYRNSRSFQHVVNNMIGELEQEISNYDNT